MDKIKQFFRERSKISFVVGGLGLVVIVLSIVSVRMNIVLEGSNSSANSTDPITTSTNPKQGISSVQSFEHNAWINPCKKVRIAPLGGLSTAPGGTLYYNVYAQELCGTGNSTFNFEASARNIDSPYFTVTPTSATVRLVKNAGEQFVARIAVRGDKLITQNYDHEVGLSTIGTYMVNFTNSIYRVEDQAPPILSRFDVVQDSPGSNGFNANLSGQDLGIIREIKIYNQDGSEIQIPGIYCRFAPGGVPGYGTLVIGRNPVSCSVRFTAQQGVQRFTAKAFDYAGNESNVLKAGPFTVGGIVDGGSTSAITVISPNGGEHWEIGQTVSIIWRRNWMPAGANGLVDIYYNTGPGVLNQFIASGVQDSTGFTWMIPSWFAVGNNYRIVLISRGSGGSPASPLSDESDSTFSISLPGSVVCLPTPPNFLFSEPKTQLASFNLDLLHPNPYAVYNYTVINNDSAACAPSTVVIGFPEWVGTYYYPIKFKNMLPGTANGGQYYAETRGNTPNGDYRLTVTAHNNTSGLEGSDSVVYQLRDPSQGGGTTPAPTPPPSGSGQLKCSLPGSDGGYHFTICLSTGLATANVPDLGPDRYIRIRVEGTAMGNCQLGQTFCSAPVNLTPRATPYSMTAQIRDAQNILQAAYGYEFILDQ